MSFIHEDNNLISQLLKLSQTTPSTPPLDRGDPWEVQTDKPELVELAKKLIANIQTELAGGVVLSAEKPDANLDLVNLVNLESFLQFLEFNGIKANGKRLVFSAQDPMAGVEGVYTNKSKDPNTTDKEMNPAYAMWPSKGAPQYYVFKNGLSLYLNDLQTKSKDNALFRAPISNLSQLVNTELQIKVVPPTAAAGTSTPTTVQPQPQAGQNKPTAALPSDLSKVIDTLPFKNEDIDFNRIKTFFQMASPFMQTEGFGTFFNQQVNYVISLIGTTQSKLKNSPIVRMGLEPISFMNLFTKEDKIGKIGDYLPIIDSLIKIIDGTRQVVELFKSAYGSKLSPAYLKQVLDQVGRNDIDTSLYTDNLRDLRRLQSFGTERNLKSTL